MTTPIVAMIAFAAGLMLCVLLAHGQIETMEVQYGEMKFLVHTYANALSKK